VGVGVGKAEIGEDVADAALDPDTPRMISSC